MTYSHNDPTYLGSIVRRVKILQTMLLEDDDITRGLSARVDDLRKQTGELERHAWNGGYKRNIGMTPISAIAGPFTEVPGLRRIRYP